MRRAGCEPPVHFGDLNCQDMKENMLTETIERQGNQRTSTAGMSALLVRVQSEYLEMPGLKLTEAQAGRLWGLEGDTCRAVLATLVRRGFLRRATNGAYVRIR